MKKKAYIAPLTEVVMADTCTPILAGSGGVSNDGQAVDFGTIETGGNAGGAAAKGNSFPIWDDED